MNFRYLGIVLIAVILSCAKTPSSTTKDNETSWKDEDICVIHNTGPVALTSDTSELALTETAQCKSLQAIKIELALDGMFLKAVGFACTQNLVNVRPQIA